MFQQLVQSRSLKILVFFTLLAISIGGCNLSSSTHQGGYVFRDGGEKAVHQDSGTLAATDAVHVDHRFGPVEVEAGQGAPSWRWELEVRGKSEEQAREIIEMIRLEVEEIEGQSTVRLVLPERQPRGMRGLESRLWLTLPSSMDVQLMNGFGPTSVTGLEGNTVLDCQHGSVTLRDLDGTVSAKTSFASMRATNIPSATLENQHGALNVAVVRGDLNAKTSFGTLEVTTVDGHARIRNQHGAVTVATVAKDADVKTSFASLRLTQVEGDAVIRNQHGSIRASEVQGSTKAETSFASLVLDVASTEVAARNQHGTLDLTLSSERLDHVAAETSFAPMKLTLAAENELRIAADTSFGKVRSDFPVNGPTTSANPNLELENQHGNIDIVRK